MVALGPITNWQPADGQVTSWTASAAAREAIRQTNASFMPPSFQQTQHLRAAFYGKALGRELPRLMVVGWEIPGVCDVGAMTEAINTHVRRHDTYHSAFEFQNGNILRRTISDPDVIDMTPTDHGHMTVDEIRRHALTTTPDTLEWDCFTFGIIQHEDKFTFYGSVDHLHIDGLSSGLIFLDIHLLYEGLSRGRPVALPEVNGYPDYTARQIEHLAGLTKSSPQIKDWVRFVQEADGDWPSFPLELGDTWAHSRGDFVTVKVLDGDETESFDTACREAGARFSGGVLTCAAMADHALTGKDVFHGFTPSDTRTRGVDTMSLGWFASLFPVTVPIGGASFADAVRAAQKSFDANKYLADVPFERVLELGLADELDIKLPTKPGMMVSYLDFRKIPCAALWQEARLGIYGDNLSHGGINVWINRYTDGTFVTVSFPDNSVARHSVHQYIAALSTAFTNIAKVPSEWVAAINHHANTSSSCAVCVGNRS